MRPSLTAISSLAAVRQMSSCSTQPEARVLIVGTGMVGSLTCYHLRNILKKEVHIDMADMARGAGGRMSTTRFGDAGTRANTGAQYVSCCTPEAAALLTAVCSSEHECSMDRIEAPERRSTHFKLQPDESYSHWLPRDGTNAVVKQFLYAGEPDSVVFEARLQRIASSAASGMLLPLFDRGGLQASYSVVILAMPPKDILKFFDTGDGGKYDPQSQADLHRHTNRGKGAANLLPGYHHVALPPSVVRQLRAPSYIGRYSLALWLGDGGGSFLRRLSEAWSKRGAPRGASNHLDDGEVIDLITVQPGGVVVVQSTEGFWREMTNAPASVGGGVKGDGRGAVGQGGRGKGGRGKGGGRGGAGHEVVRAHLATALEDLAGESMPRALHSKLLNWRTSQADRVLPPSESGTPAVITAEEGKLIFTGDWCAESSFEGCHQAALAAATAAMHTLGSLAKPPQSGQGVSSRHGVVDVSEGRGLSVGRGMSVTGGNGGDDSDDGGRMAMSGGKGNSKGVGDGKGDGGGKGGGKGGGHGKGGGRGSKRGHDSSLH